MPKGRRGPDSGYEFGQKRHYRRCVWRTFRRHFRGHMADKRFALMPSSEGSEIAVAIHVGCRERNLCVIDQNPAIVATLKRKYPKLSTYGVTADRAATRIAADIGELHGANLDLCGGADRPLFKTLNAWAHARVIADQGLIAVNCLRGRERGAFAEPVTTKEVRVGRPRSSFEVSPRDRLRLQWISVSIAGLAPRDVIGRTINTVECAARCIYAPRCINFGVYASAAGHQTMLWSVYEVHQNPCVCDACCIVASGLSHADPFVIDHFRTSAWIPLLVKHWGVEAVERNIVRDMPQFKSTPYARSIFGQGIAERIEQVT